VFSVVERGPRASSGRWGESSAQDENEQQDAEYDRLRAMRDDREHRASVPLRREAKDEDVE
jgi:hypothetical protein